MLVFTKPLQYLMAIEYRRGGWRIFGALRQVVAASCPAQPGQFYERVSVPIPTEGNKEKDSSEIKKIYNLRDCNDIVVLVSNTGSSS